MYEKVHKGNLPKKKETKTWNCKKYIKNCFIMLKLQIYESYEKII